MTITRADSKQEEFFTSNGKLYVNFEQVEKTDEEGNTFWEMKTLEVQNKKSAYEQIKAHIREEKLYITILANGLRFYTDDESMIDLIAADRKAERLGATDLDFTEWKTADGIKQVQIKDIREAIDLRLATKGGIVGVSS